MKYFNKTVLATTVALTASQAMAAGFQLNSQSATGVGRAFSGDAVIADNASVLSRNPAAMALFDKQSLSLGLTYADIDVAVKDVEMAATPIGFGSEHKAAENKFIPNLYFIAPMNDRVAIGFAAFSNFGTGTDTGALANNAVTVPGMGTIPAPVDLLGNTEVMTMNFNTSLSYRLNAQLSFGLGVDAIYGQGKLSREGNLPLGSNGAMVNAKLVDIDADGWALGAILGGVYEFDANNRLGMSYRFSPEFTATGDINLFNTQALAQVVFDEISIPLPDIFQVAGFHQLTDSLALHYTAQRTSWGDFDQITVRDGHLNDMRTGDARLKHYAWDDSWLFSVGTTYKLGYAWTLRGGYMKDKGVVDSISSVSIPDSDRKWYTAGATYRMSQVSSLDMGLAFVRGEDVEVLETSAITGNTLAHTRSNAVYYSLQYSRQF
jgi:long-chain fatty acid transport protein